MLVELRAGEHMTVFPPSIHEEGEQIEWERFEAPGECLAEDLEAAVGRVAAASVLARHWPNKGSRHEARLALAGGLLRCGFSEEDAANFVLAVCTASHCADLADCAKATSSTARKLQDGDKNVKGWPTLATLVGDEVVTLVCQWLGIRNNEREPELWLPPIPLGSSPDVPAFPVEVFPEALQRFISAAAAALPCPPDYLAVPLLVMGGGLIGASRALAIKTKHIQRAALYAAVIGSPGTAKTPALEAVVDPVHEIDEEAHALWEQAMEQYETDLEDYEKQKREAKANKEDPPDKPAKPLLSRQVVDDATAESLAPILKENPRGVVMVVDELIGWVQRMNCYRDGGKGADRQFWLSAWSGKTTTIDRKKTHDLGPIRIRKPFVGVIGGLTPDKLPTLRGDKPRQRIEQDGFLDRLLLSFPTEIPATEENWQDISEEMSQLLADVFAKLRTLEMVPIQEDLILRGWRPFLIKLTASGKVAWQSFTRQLAAERNAPDFPPYLVGPWAKFRGYGGRLALILHFLRWACGEIESDTADVDGEGMNRAARLIDYFKAHARKVYAVIDADPRIADARHVLQWLESHPETVVFSRRDVHQGLRRNTRFENPEKIDAPLKLLEEYGYIRSIPTGGTTQRGRPAAAKFERNPLKPYPQYPQYPQKDAPTKDGQTPTETFEDKEDIEDISEGENGEFGDGVPKTPTPPKNSPGHLQNPSGTYPQRPQYPQNGTQEQSSSPAYQLVQDTADLPTVANAIEESAIIGLDTETTGLDPRTERIRLLSLDCDTVDGGRFTYLVDCFAVDPAPLLEALAGKPLVMHHAAFDLSFLHHRGFTPTGPVHDTFLLAQLLAAGTFDKCGLEAVVERELNRKIDKTHQKADWSGVLTAAQLQYAADDATVLFPLYEALTAKIEAANLGQAAEIEQRCLPAVVWTANSGVAFDRHQWETLATSAKTEAQRLAAELDAAAPRKTDSFAFASWNWDSPPQMQEVFALVGIPLDKTDDETLAGINHPLAGLLRQYRDAQKRATTYGRDWLKHVVDDGRVYAGWKQYGAKTGRMASGDPNMQNVPRDPAYRQCFHPAPGRVLVKADYSQIELRIAAKVANETNMIEAYVRGDDLHKLTAQRMTGKADVTKQERQLAKPVNFGLIYGLGAPSLCRKAKTDYGLNLSEADAQRYRAAFFAAYPAIQKWHNVIKRQKSTETRTLTGRRVLVDADYWYGGRANYIVQGTGGDGIKLALALLWERRHEMPGVFPVLIVHDEIVVECDCTQAEAVAAWLTKAMLDGMAPLIDPVPCEVETKIVPTWGG